MMLIAAVAAFGLLMAGPERVQAQSTNSATDAALLLSLPTGNFVGATEADVILAAQVSTLKGMLGTLTPGTSGYAVAERAAVYFNTLQMDIAGGKDVPQAILDGLIFIQHYESTSPAAGGVFTGIASSTASLSELLGLRSQAIDLLEQ